MNQYTHPNSQKNVHKTAPREPMSQNARISSRFIPVRLVLDKAINEMVRR